MITTAKMILLMVAEFEQSLLKSVVGFREQMENSRAESSFTAVSSHKYQASMLLVVKQPSSEYCWCRTSSTMGSIHALKSISKFSYTVCCVQALAEVSASPPPDLLFISRLPCYLHVLFHTLRRACIEAFSFNSAVFSYHLNWLQWVNGAAG